MAEIGWTHNVIILDRCKDPLRRELYVRMARKMGWSPTPPRLDEAERLLMQLASEPLSEAVGPA